MSARAAASSSLSVVVPVYNEIELLDSQVRRLAEFLGRAVPEHEIVLVESGSTDGTRERSDLLAATIPNCSVHHQATRAGFGSAVRLGYAAARRDVVMLMPIDIPYPLEAVLHALSLIDGRDAVLSYRADDRRGPFRRVQSGVYNALAKTVLGLPMRSVNSALKLYRREFLARIALRSNGWLLDAELLFWLDRLGCRYAEIPIPLIDRSAGVSKVRPLDTVRMAAGLVRLRWELESERRRLKQPCR